jgi:protein N-lysine methyltransferase METTL21A
MAAPSNTTSQLSLAEEELLDAIDPLRHLCSADDPELLPPQTPSICDQIIQVNIRAPSVHPEETHRTITLSLAVDSRPGCGGIAWPAGEVRPLVDYHHHDVPNLTNVRHW